jgi:hypothetical protein
LSWGIKDQYEVNGSEAANNTGNLILKTAFDLHNIMRPSIRMNGYRSWILSEATGGPDDIYHGAVFARHTDSEGSCSPDKNGLGNPKIRYCDPGHSFCCTEGFSIIRFPFVIRR